jgi:ferredoxin
MKVRVDADKCSGHGQCYSYADAVFSADENGFNAARGQTLDVTPELEDDARRGALACPEQAIDVIEN